MKESSLIAFIRSVSGFDPALVPVGPGDDMAVVRCGDQDLLVATDQVLDGVHFLLADHGPRAAGRKAMARNLSDVAAMAAEPLAAVATVALPRGFAENAAKELYAGLRELGDAFACPLVGGDIGTWDGALAVSLTILARCGPRGAVLRSGARAGDAICVTASLGGGWHGEHHLTFTPRVREALALAERCELHAMIDISDGLAADLGHICEMSGVGADVDAAAVPISQAGRERPDPLAAALGDGEDYELLFTLPAADAESLMTDQSLATPVARIGTIVAGPARTLILPDGRRAELAASGWEHGT